MLTNAVRSTVWELAARWHVLQIEKHRRRLALVNTKAETMRVQLRLPPTI